MAKIYGTPGRSVKGISGNKQVKIVGAKTERTTAKYLEAYFYGNDEVSIWHDLKAPGLKTANVDHIVWYRNRIVVIDSKAWAPGFIWTLRGKTFRGLKRFAPADKLHLQASVQHITNRFPYLDVQGILWIEPANKKKRMIIRFYRPFLVKPVFAKRGAKTVSKIMIGATELTPQQKEDVQKYLKQYLLTSS